MEGYLGIGTSVSQDVDALQAVGRAFKRGWMVELHAHHAHTIHPLHPPYTHHTPNTPTHQCWEAAVNVASEHLPGQLRTVVASVARKLQDVQRHDTAAKLLKVGVG